MCGASKLCLFYILAPSIIVSMEVSERDIP